MDLVCDWLAARLGCVNSDSTFPEDYSGKLRSHGGGHRPEAPERAIFIEDLMDLRPFLC